MNTKKKALVVDDEQTSYLLLENLLLKAQFDVTVVHNGADGLAKFAKEDFDVVILDLIMPVMNGFQFLEAVEALGPDRQHSPGRVVIVHSSVTNYEQLKDTLKYKCVFAVKPKPCGPGEMEEMIKCMLEDRLSANSATSNM